MMRVSVLTRFLIAAVASLSLIVAAEPSITPETTTVLLNYGEADAVVTVIAEGGETSIQVSESTLYSVGEITSVAAGGYTNYSIPLSMDGNVGTDDIKVTVGTEEVVGKVICAGLVIKDSGKAVSGDNGDGVVVGVEGSFTFDVMAVGIDGAAVDVSTSTFVGMAMTGTYMKTLDVESSSISSTMFTLAVNKYRVSESGFKVMFDVPAIAYNGETHETVLKVTHSSTDVPCGAIAGTYTSTDGKVTIDMFNVKEGDVVSIGVGTSSGSADLDASSLAMPDQKIIFSFATAGTAVIKCNDVQAYVKGGDVVIDVSTTTESLAKDYTVTVPEEEGKDQMVATLSFTKLSPDTLSLALAQKVQGEFCTEINSNNCGYISVVQGSAVVEYAGNIEPDSGDTARSALEAALAEPDCKMQKNVDLECEDLKYVSSTVKAVGGPMISTATGLATWTIVLIAALGALALIVLIMLGLLAVYRRSAEQSESDYSSSGPLGVPDPSDLLYEQSIVRDIYGRGDFPDGGPSAAQAEQREREAALREEFPRPPSTSGLSRGTATDDASSTYSV